MKKRKKSMACEIAKRGDVVKCYDKKGNLIRIGIPKKYRDRLK